eukprot:scaffold683983_cov102-Attheya_sp.AAC.1
MPIPVTLRVKRGSSALPAHERHPISKKQRTTNIPSIACDGRSGSADLPWPMNQLSQSEMIQTPFPAPVLLHARPPTTPHSYSNAPPPPYWHSSNSHSRSRPHPDPKTAHHIIFKSGPTQIPRDQPFQELGDFKKINGHAN